MMGQQNQGNSLVASANNSIATMQVAQAAATAAAGPEQTQSLFAAPAFAAAAVVENGRALDVFGDASVYDQARREINGRMT